MTANDRSGKLTRRQRNAIGALLTSRTVQEAAKAAGAGEKTIRRWLDDRNFVAAIEAARAEALKVVLQRLSSLAVTAVETLEAVMLSSAAPHSAKVRAANATLTNLLKVREITAIEERITRLEERLNR
ncbi:MAG TPA: hypothetical protein PLC98_08010 [Anaerolineales bacterium]|nr:hypothetical protein [Anaerolineales bacterium]